ncbi:serine O-acetyltransferase EpsC [Listeria fleischmannii]|jgi:serine O-acetyltransferase|uniref:Serine acetyltransferase n=2 Tax=Listeria fleischmannii TaxID=1069827 RepID=W7DHK4_9LIST|nr:serine O-acetyltransferase EpsC [Listeria fleischmannii]EIA20364.1 serine O-acetyltransferase [Listeria fleischmannii subsp. coloradonensis]EUJ44833.1 serine O-acetyltransferase [Listeria fleischmannii FSL S10-1203]MBC1399187.1 serine O-acetyltransferase [Listeria fleischmannii]MBC1419222.1 serine O-acetyltransferase [Listeria fleischmannii]MBC1427449.1 serine O-acetyltransferase [Listeria fleischmannii]
MARKFIEDLDTVIKNDPATRKRIDAFFTNAGVHAIWTYRVAHFFYKHNMIVFSKMLSQFARFMTNIEIHPGAEIGRRLFIDHGAGVVIGETAEIGTDVVLFHGVTLGGTGKDSGKRHPTVRNGVLISAGVKILGPIEIGTESKVGAGAVVLKDVPPHSTVVGIPAKVVRLNGRTVAHTEPNLELLYKRMEQLEEKLAKLERGDGE